MAVWLSWPVLSRTGVYLLAAACVGVSLSVFGSSLMNDENGLLTLVLLVVPFGAAGVGLSAYRLFRLKTEDVTLEQKRALWVIANLVVIPTNVLTLLTILLVFTAPFLMAFGVIDPHGRANFSPEARAFGLWLTGAWFFAAYEFWFDAMCLSQEIEMDEWRLANPAAAAELDAVSHAGG